MSGVGENGNIIVPLFRGLPDGWRTPVSGQFVNVRTVLPGYCPPDEGTPLNADRLQDTLVICHSLSGQEAKIRQKSSSDFIRRWQCDKTNPNKQILPNLPSMCR